MAEQIEKYNSESVNSENLNDGSFEKIPTAEEEEKVEAAEEKQEMDNVNEKEEVVKNEHKEEMESEPVKKTDKTFEENILKLTSFLISQGTDIIKKHIINRFKNVEEFESLLTKLEPEMATDLPPNVYKRLYQDDKRPKSFDNLGLKACFVLVTYQKFFKDKFNSPERLAVKKLSDLLFTIYCISENVLMKQDLSTVKTDLFSTLCILGLKSSDLEEQYENFVPDMKKAENLISELSQDNLFKAVFLKKAKDLLKSNKNDKNAENIKRIDEKIEQIEQFDQLNELDNMCSQSHAIQYHLHKCLVCPFCSDPYQDPKTLPCLHSACAHCLKSHLNHGDKTVTCPVCQTRVSAVDDQAINNLPCTFVLQNLMKFVKRLQGLTGGLQCESCVHLPLYYNIHDGLVYCQTHGYPLYHMPGQVVISGTDLLKNDKVAHHLQSFCPQHQQPLRQFCVSCKVPLCSSSACIAWHSQHGALKSMDDENRSILKDLEKFSSLLDKKQEVFVQKCKSAEANQVIVADLQENIKSSIDKYFTDIEMVIKDKKMQFISDLNKAVDASWNQDEATRHAITEWNKKLETFTEDYSNVVNAPAGPSQCSLTTLISMKHRMLDFLADTASGCSLAELKSLSYPEGELRSLLQHVSTLTSNITAQPSSRGWEVAGRCSGLRYFLVAKNTMYVFKRTMLTGCTIVAFDLKELGGQFTVYYTQGGMHDFQAIALDEKGQLLIPGETLTTLDLSSMSLKKFVTAAVVSHRQEKVSSINFDCLNTYNKVILKSSVEEVDGKRTEKLYLGDDQCICELVPNHKGGYMTARKFDFYTMLQIADFTPETSRDLLVVTDASKHSVMIFNCRSHTMLTIGGQGATPGNFCYPSGVAIDQFGHIFVADGGNSRIQVLDFNGKFVRLMSYPQELKSITDQVTSNGNIKVQLQVHEDYLYLFDPRLETVWRLKYL